MKKVRVALCAAIVVALAFCLAACSVSAKQDSSSSTSSNDKQKTSEPTKVNVGEMFTIPDMFEITLESAEWVDELKPSDTSSFYTYMPHQDGKTYFVVRGTVKNIGNKKETLGGTTDNLSAAMKFNNKYDIEASARADSKTGFTDDIEPLTTAECVFYGSVSNEIKDQFELCDLTLTARVPDENGVWDLDQNVGKWTAQFK